MRDTTRYAKTTRGASVRSVEGRNNNCSHTCEKQNSTWVVICNGNPMWSTKITTLRWLKMGEGVDCRHIWSYAPESNFDCLGCSIIPNFILVLKSYMLWMDFLTRFVAQVLCQHQDVHTCKSFSYLTSFFTFYYFGSYWLCIND